MHKNLFIILAVFLSTFKSLSQSITIDNDHIAQGEKLLEAYFSPMAECFGASLNNGWYNTAKPHKLGGFDLTFSLNTVIIPNSTKKFNIKDAGGNIFVSAENEAATILGGEEQTEMIYNYTTTDLPDGDVKFSLPGGLNPPTFALPMMQVGIGLIKKTAVDIRYMPLLDIGKVGKVNLFGVGVKHDILQWVPIIGDAIPISLSLQTGYTNLNSEVVIYDQKIFLNTKATTINLVASRKFLMLTSYVGVGYNNSNTTLSADADFDIDGIKFDEKVEVSFESQKNIRANIGIRLNITLVTIHADYTFSKYPTVTLGVGVGLR